MEPQKGIEVKRLEGLKEERFGQISRRVFFSPRTTGNSFLKMAFIEVPPGSAGTAHVHLGEEVFYTIKGRAILTVDGREYQVEPGTCCLIPPEVAHPARVIGQENWVAVAAYCDECPVLKKARGKEGIDYPVPTAD